MSYAIAEMKPTIHNAIKIDPTPLKLNSIDHCVFLLIINGFRKLNQQFRNILCFMMVTAQSHQTFKKIPENENTHFKVSIFIAQLIDFFHHYIILCLYITQCGNAPWPHFASYNFR